MPSGSGNVASVWNTTPWGRSPSRQLSSSPLSTSVLRSATRKNTARGSAPSLHWLATRRLSKPTDPGVAPLCRPLLRLTPKLASYRLPPRQVRVYRTTATRNRAYGPKIRVPLALRAFTRALGCEAFGVSLISWPLIVREKPTKARLLIAAFIVVGLDFATYALFRGI